MLQFATKSFDNNGSCWISVNRVEKGEYDRSTSQDKYITEDAIDFIESIHVSGTTRTDFMHLSLFCFDDEGGNEEEFSYYS